MAVLAHLAAAGVGLLALWILISAERHGRRLNRIGTVALAISAFVFLLNIALAARLIRG